tara:strand:+ start:1035 stop:1856 length:822 start_codon:yes stop_codon:yes gene_type:complete
MSKFKKNELKKSNFEYIGGIKAKNKKKIRRPLISIITVVKNDEKKILKTINSVFNQTFKNYEYIVIDGLSSDKTMDILKKNQKKIHYLASGKDKNLWDAMNKGILLSSGKIIGIINSGDIFYKNTLKIVKNYFNESNLDYLFGPVKKDRVLFRFEPEKIFYRFNIYPSHSTGFFITKNSQKKIGLYNVDFNFGSDYDFFYKLIKNKKLKGKIAKKKEVFGKFNLKGLTSNIPFYISYYYEMKIRLKNGQNIFYLFFLYWIKFFNKIYRLIKNI